MKDERTLTTMVADRPSTVDLGLTLTQQDEVALRLQAFDLATLGGTEIVQLGLQDGAQLREVLDDFLGRVDVGQGQALYDLCERISDGVQEADLSSLRDQILQEPKLTWFQWAFTRARKSAQQMARSAYDQAVSTANVKTTQLSLFLKGLETEVTTELGKLRNGVGDLEELKNAYREMTDKFMVSVGVAQQLRQQARDRVFELKRKAQSEPGSVSYSIIEDAETQCQLLESRALALETTVSRLPADWVVIQQIQAAGIATFQEVVTTAGDRFNAIKMTLLTLNGLLQVRGVQMIADRQQNLDDHLAGIRGGLMKEVVRTAANAPGENRLQQAIQLKRIVDDTMAMKALVVEARDANAKKFEEARGLITSAREQLLAIAVDQSQNNLKQEGERYAITAE